MKLTPTLALLLSICAAPISAGAQTQATGRFGLGMETTLVAPLAQQGGVLFVYDLDQFRIDGLFGIGVLDDDVTFGVGARFHWVLHQVERADFSIGGGGFVFHGALGGGPFGGSATRGEIDVVAQIRAFLIENVSLQGALGMGLGFGDGGVSLVIAAQLTATLGLVYFF
jgi:hypothetical protein